MWHEIGESLDSELLQLCNARLDAYVAALVAKGPGLQYLVPQYMCLVRSGLTRPMLRRYMAKIMPRLPAEAAADVRVASAALLRREIDVRFPAFLSQSLPQITDPLFLFVFAVLCFSLLATHKCAAPRTRQPASDSLERRFLLRGHKLSVVIQPPIGVLLGVLILGW